MSVAERISQSPGSNENQHQTQGRPTDNRRCSNVHRRIRETISPGNWTCVFYVLKQHLYHLVFSKFLSAKDLPVVKDLHLSEHFSKYLRIVCKIMLS